MMRFMFAQIVKTRITPMLPNKDINLIINKKVKDYKWEKYLKKIHL